MAAFPATNALIIRATTRGIADGGFLRSLEIILVENYGEIYEGSVGAISDDGWRPARPTPSSSVNSRDPILPGEGTGFIVSIMNTTNSNGSANTLAGEWFPIAQQVSVSPPEFLMQSPLPAGSYTISIASASVGDQYTYNTINTGSNPCTAIQLPGNQFGTQVLHNTIIQVGGYVYPWYAIAILLEVIYTDVAAAAPTPTYPYPLETTWTRVPDLGVTIAYNTIENSPGGIEIDVDHGPQINASTGRLYLKAIVDDNTIEWTQAWLNSWGAPDNGASETFYGLVDTNGNPANSPADNSRPPTITVGDGFSVNGRSPATVDNPSGTPNGPKGYVDPNEVNVTVQGNLAEILPSTGAPQLQAEPTGQVYAGVINGVVSPTSAFPYNEPTNYRWADTLYNGQNYYAPYDADNLNINGSTTSGATQVNLSGAFKRLTESRPTTIRRPAISTDTGTAIRPTCWILRQPEPADLQLRHARHQQRHPRDWRTGCCRSPHAAIGQRQQPRFPAPGHQRRADGYASPSPTRTGPRHLSHRPGPRRLDYYKGELGETAKW